MKFISRLMPQEGRFFEFFAQHAALIGHGGNALVDLLSAYDKPMERSKFIDRIESLEHQADRVTRDTVSLLHSTFVTPFDRDDIHRLISRMDDILDLIQDTAESTVLYDIQSMTPEARQLGDCVKRCCDQIERAVGLLSSMENGPEILRICQEIDVLESDADRIMRAAISSLFRNEADVRQLIKLKAVYELLEAATDKCQDVANVIESVVLENA
jgi:predicted phosphate transport protein (TIGR00153 family)